MIAVNVSVATQSAAITIAVLADDIAQDGDTLTVTTIGTPTNGTAVLNADNTVTYTPGGGLASSDSFLHDLRRARRYIDGNGHGGVDQSGAGGGQRQRRFGGATGRD